MTLPPDPQPYVVIGLKEVYDAVLRLQAIVERQTSQQDEHARDLSDHETRLRVVEASQPARNIAEIRADVERLKAGRWPLPTIAALAGIGALIVAILAFIYRSH